MHSFSTQHCRHTVTRTRTRTVSLPCRVLHKHSASALAICMHSGTHASSAQMLPHVTEQSRKNLHLHQLYQLSTDMLLTILLLSSTIAALVRVYGDIIHQHDRVVADFFDQRSDWHQHDRQSSIYASVQHGRMRAGTCVEQSNEFLHASTRAAPVGLRYVCLLISSKSVSRMTR